MSTGARITLADAEKAAAYLFDRWGLDHETCMVVGSVRRRRPDVGDLELVAPGWDGSGTDSLFERIAGTMDGLVDAKAAGPANLFSPMSSPPTVAEVQVVHAVKPIGRVVQGLKPGFKHARLSLRRRDGSEIACEVYRYTPENRGWVTLQRTGPREFGIAFLSYWKQRFGVPREQQASMDGHLVDAVGSVVPVRSEAEAFEKCGLSWMAPEKRDEFAADWSRAQARSGR